MSTRINVNIGDGGLLDRNAQQQAAARQANQQRATAEKAAAEGQRQLEEERISQGCDPVIGERLFSAGSSSRIQRIDQEPAAFRRGDLPMIGNAWTCEDASNVYVGSGNGNTWTTVPKPSWTSNFFDYRPDNYPPTVSTFAQAAADAPRPDWAIGLPLKQVPGFQIWYYYLPGEPNAPFSLWWAVPAGQTTLGVSGTSTYLETFPLKDDKGLTASRLGRGYFDAWDYGLYAGEIRDGLATNAPPEFPWRDYYYRISTGTSTAIDDSINVVETTKGSSRLVQTPAWVLTKLLPEDMGELRIVPPSSVTQAAFRLAGQWHQVLLRITSVEEPGFQVQPTIALFDQLTFSGASWANDAPTFTQYSGGFFDIEFPNREFQQWPFTNVPLNPQAFQLASNRLAGLPIKIRNPITYYYISRDYKGDGTTPESRAAYGIPKYIVEPDTQNYGPSSANVLNAWALPPVQSGTELQDATFARIVDALFFAYITDPRKTIKRSPLVPTATLPIQVSPLLPINLVLHLYFDWESPPPVKAILASLYSQQA